MLFRSELPGGEIYRCKANRWTASAMIFDSSRRELVGYLLKKTEACLRRAVKYKRSITASPASFSFDFNRMKIPLDELNDAVESAVAGFHRELSRTVVTVDVKNLARIRKEAMGTQEKLIVPEADDSPAHDTAPVKAPLSSPAPDLDRWGILWESLGEAELRALSIMLRGGDIRAFADKCGIMLEVLADSINEKASDHIGDNILETDEGMTVYDEYRDKISEMVGEG